MATIYNDPNDMSYDAAEQYADAFDSAAAFLDREGCPYCGGATTECILAFIDNRPCGA